MHFKELSFTSARVNNVLLTLPLLVTKQYNLEEGLNLNTEFRRLLFCSIGVTRTPFKDILLLNKAILSTTSNFSRKLRVEPIGQPLYLGKRNIIEYGFIFKHKIILTFYFYTS